MRWRQLSNLEELLSRFLELVLSKEIDPFCGRLLSICRKRGRGIFFGARLLYPRCENSEQQKSSAETMQHRNQSRSLWGGVDCDGRKTRSVIPFIFTVPPGGG